MYYYKWTESPVGKLKLVASDNGLAAILWENENPMRVRLARLVEDNTQPVLVETETQLNEYFEKKRNTFAVKLDPAGTAFQRKVWQALLKIPIAQTITYSDLAARVGEPSAVRAAGAATGKNPIGIIIPCHRVVGKNGSMVGYVGGLERKRHLLELEQSSMNLNIAVR